MSGKLIRVDFGSLRSGADRGKDALFERQGPDSRWNGLVGILENVACDELSCLRCAQPKNSRIVKIVVNRQEVNRQTISATVKSSDAFGAGEYSSGYEHLVDAGNDETRLGRGIWLETPALGEAVEPKPIIGPNGHIMAVTRHLLRAFAEYNNYHCSSGRHGLTKKHFYPGAPESRKIGTLVEIYLLSGLASKARVTDEEISNVLGLRGDPNRAIQILDLELLSGIENVLGVCGEGKGKATPHIDNNEVMDMLVRTAGYMASEALGSRYSERRADNSRTVTPRPTGPGAA
jgi:hypothetical protein